MISDRRFSSDVTQIEDYLPLPMWYFCILRRIGEHVVILLQDFPAVWWMKNLLTGVRILVDDFGVLAPHLLREIMLTLEHDPPVKISVNTNIRLHIGAI